MLSKIDLLTGSGEVSENEDNDGIGTAIGHPEEKCQAEVRVCCIWALRVVLHLLLFLCYM
jgi:hypothetical protein